MCYEGDVRLVGGSNPAEGIVEVCQDNRFGTICDEDWDELDALVPCRRAFLFGKLSLNSAEVLYCQFGFHWYFRTVFSMELMMEFFSGGEVADRGLFGLGSGDILATEVACNGSEYSLHHCPNSTNIPDSCNHENDAAVICQPGISKRECDCMCDCMIEYERYCIEHLSAIL